MPFECQSLDMLLGVILRYTFGLVLRQSICPRAGLVQGSSEQVHKKLEDAAPQNDSCLAPGPEKKAIGIHTAWEKYARYS